MLGKKVQDNLVATSSEKKSFPKWLIWAVLAVVVIFVAFFALTSLGGKKDTGLNFYNTFSSIFSSELGSYKYVLDVRTAPSGTFVSSSNKGASISDMENMDAADDTSVEGVGSGKSFVEWIESADVKSTDWQYPNYQVTIEGYTTSTEPYSTYMNISIATEYYNNVLTDITCFNGNYYINVESLRDWLVNSGDAYLISLGKELPQGSKYLVIPENEFVVTSRYAEDGELEFSSSIGFRETERRLAMGIKMLFNSLSSSMGSTGISSSDTVSRLNLTGNNSLTMLKSFKSLFGKSGDFYTSLLETNKEKGYYTDSQYLQAVREKDNFLSAVNDMLVYLNTVDFSDMNLNTVGDVRKYTNGKGNMTIEGNLGFSFTTDTRDYTIQLSAMRSGDKNEVRLPSGSTFTKSSLASPTLVRDSLYSLVDYLNVSNIKLAEKLEITPENIASDSLDSFISLVNDVGAYEVYVTRFNVQEYIDKYKYMEVDKNTPELDVINYNLVHDYIENLNNLTGTLIIDNTDVEEYVEQYPRLDFDSDDLRFTFTYNEEESSARLLVLDGQVINMSDNYKEFETSDFSVQTLLSSMYPANNDILLRNYDNKFDLESIEYSIVVPPKYWDTFKLYFVLSDDSGHMDLFYKKDKYGTVIQY